MDFQGFLGNVKTKGKFASSKDFFDSLNHTNEMGMSLRNFQLLEKGNQPPSFKAFGSIFRKLNRPEYREAVISFLTSNLDPVEDAALIKYVTSHLLEPVAESTDSIWETKRPSLYYNNEQMIALTQDEELMRLHHTLLLHEKLPMDKLADLKTKVDRLIELELAVIENHFVHSIRTLVRVPHYQNSAPSAVRKASKMLFKHLDLYASLEGSQNQVMSYAIQHLPKECLKEVLDKMENFKKWIQSLASPKTDSTVVPFVYIAWGKALSQKELSCGKDQPTS